MNQTIKQSQAIYQGLQARVQMSTSQMYAILGRDEPVRIYRHTVVPCGNNEFSVVDRETDRTRAMCTGIDKAVRFAKRIDEKPVSTQVQPTGKKPDAFATFMLRWTCAIAFCLGMFAFFGAHP